MRIDKREARKRFDNGETVYCYPKLAKTEYDYIGETGMIYTLYKPYPIHTLRDAPEFDFDHEVRTAEMLLGKGIWFAVPTE